MRRGGLFIGFSATAALAYLAHRSLAKVGRAIDEAFVFGDVIAVPADAIGSARRRRAGSVRADATDAKGLVALHPDLRP